MVHDPCATLRRVRKEVGVNLVRMDANDLPRIDRLPPEAFLAQRKSEQYRPNTLSTDWYNAGIDGRPRFNYFAAVRMSKDPQVQFGMRILRAPLYQLEVDVEASSERVGRFVRQQFQDFWDAALRRILTSQFTYGPAVGETSHRLHRGVVQFDRFDDFRPGDCRPLLRRKAGKQSGGKLVGVRVQGGGCEAFDVYAPHGFWHSGEAEYGQYWSRPRIADAYEPWLEKRGKNGAVDCRRLWFKKGAFTGGQLRYPLGKTTVVGEDGSNYTVDNQDLAQRILDQWESGGTLSLPNTRDQNGNYKWEFTPPGAGQEVKNILDYPKELDTEMLKGMGIPPEIVEAATVGSGYSGRAIPAQVFFSSEDEIAADVVRTIDTQVIKPMVRTNYGPRAEYRIRHRSLAKLVAESDPRSNAQRLQEPDPRQAMGGGLPGLSLSLDSINRKIRRLSRQIDLGQPERDPRLAALYDLMLQAAERIADGDEDAQDELDALAEIAAEITGTKIDLAWVEYGTSRSGKKRWKDDQTGKLRYQESRPGEAREKRDRSHAKANELIEAHHLSLNDPGKHPPLTPKQWGELADHLPAMTRDKLRNVRNQLLQGVRDQRTHGEWVDRLRAEVKSRLEAKPEPEAPTPTEKANVPEAPDSSTKQPWEMAYQHASEGNLEKAMSVFSAMPLAELKKQAVEANVSTHGTNKQTLLDRLRQNMEQLTPDAREKSKKRQQADSDYLDARHLVQASEDGQFTPESDAYAAEKMGLLGKENAANWREVRDTDEAKAHKAEHDRKQLGDVIAKLDPSDPRHAELIERAKKLNAEPEAEPKQIDPEHQRQIEHGRKTDKMFGGDGRYEAELWTQLRKQNPDAMLPKLSKAGAEYAADLYSADGKPVPAEVLADYPDLAAKYGKGEEKATDPVATARQRFKDVINTKHTNSKDRADAIEAARADLEAAEAKAKGVSDEDLAIIRGGRPTLGHDGKAVFADHSLDTGNKVDDQFVDANKKVDQQPEAKPDEYTTMTKADGTRVVVKNYKSPQEIENERVVAKLNGTAPPNKISPARQKEQQAKERMKQLTSLSRKELEALAEENGIDHTKYPGDYNLAVAIRFALPTGDAGNDSETPKGSKEPAESPSKTESPRDRLNRLRGSIPNAGSGFAANKGDTVATMGNEAPAGTYTVIGASRDGSTYTIRPDRSKMTDDQKARLKKDPTAYDRKVNAAEIIPTSHASIAKRLSATVSDASELVLDAVEQDIERMSQAGKWSASPDAPEQNSAKPKTKAAREELAKSKQQEWLSSMAEAGVNPDTPRTPEAKALEQSLLEGLGQLQSGQEMTEPGKYRDITDEEYAGVMRTVDSAIAQLKAEAGKPGPDIAPRGPESPNNPLDKNPDNATVSPSEDTKPQGGTKMEAKPLTGSPSVVAMGDRERNSAINGVQKRIEYWRAISQRPSVEQRLKERADFEIESLGKRLEWMANHTDAKWWAEYVQHTNNYATMTDAEFERVSTFAVQKAKQPAPQQAKPAQQAKRAQQQAAPKLPDVSLPDAPEGYSTINLGGENILKHNDRGLMIAARNGKFHLLGRDGRKLGSFDTFEAAKDGLDNF